MTADVAGDGVPGADVIIEAIFENADAKHELFARLEPRMKASAILASNTSSIMLEQLDDQLPDPGKLVGVHFFNPVAQLPLVEIVRGENSSEECDPEGHRVHAQDRQAAPALQERAGLSRQSRARAVPLRSHVRAAGRHSDRSHRRSGAALSACPWDRWSSPTSSASMSANTSVTSCRRRSTSRSPTPRGIDALIAAKKLGRKSGEGFYVWRDGKAVKSGRSRRRAARRSRGSPDPRARERMRRRAARGNRRGRGSHRRRRDLRLRICAVPWRAAHLRAQARRRRRGRATPGTLRKRMDRASRPTADGQRLASGALSRLGWRASISACHRMPVKSALNCCDP